MGDRECREKRHCTPSIQICFYLIAINNGDVPVATGVLKADSVPVLELIEYMEMVLSPILET